MCGRFSITSSYEAIKSRYGIEDDFEWKPIYNAAPSQNLPVIREKGKIEFLNWGFMPHGAKERRPVINARADSVDKPYFKSSFENKRFTQLIRASQQ